MPACPLLLVPWSLDYNSSPLVPPCLVPLGFLTQLLLHESVKEQIFLEREKYEPEVGWLLNAVCQPQCHRTVSPLLWDSSDTAVLSLVCGKSVSLSSAQKRKIRKEIKVSYCIYCCAGFFFTLWKAGKHVALEWFKNAFWKCLLETKLRCLILHVRFGALLVYHWLTVISSATLTKRRENGHWQWGCWDVW